MTYLDFEKPVVELSEQLEKAKQIAEKSNIDMSSSLLEIEKRIDLTKKEIYKNLSAWQKVQISRHPDRPYTLSYIQSITDNDFIELHGDRTVKDDKAIVGGLGSIDGQSVMFIGHQKGN